MAFLLVGENLMLHRTIQLYQHVAKPWVLNVGLICGRTSALNTGAAAKRRSPCSSQLLVLSPTLMRGLIVVTQCLNIGSVHRSNVHTNGLTE